MRRRVPGIIYLIHFDRPLVFTRQQGNQPVTVAVRHYLGWTEGQLTAGLDSYDLLERMTRHLSGDGARILAALNEKLIGWKPVAAWDKHHPPHWMAVPKGHRLARWSSGEVFKATRFDERRMKRQRNAPRFCPVCAGKGAELRLVVGG
jgi:hypothetical protein